MTTDTQPGFTVRTRHGVEYHRPGPEHRTGPSCPCGPTIDGGADE